MSGLLVWKAFNHVGGNTLKQPEKYDSDSSSRSGRRRRRRRHGRGRGREAEKEMSDG